MSQADVMKFFESVRSDEAAAGRLRGASGNLDEFARLVAEMGRDRGFRFEPDDVLETFDALVAKSEGEPSEKDLQAVAGGGVVVATAACVTLGGAMATATVCGPRTAAACFTVPFCR